MLISKTVARNILLAVREDAPIDEKNLLELLEQRERSNHDCPRPHRKKVIRSRRSEIV
jgi:hypothetical protein